MPIYTRHCIQCDRFFDTQCKIAEKESFQPECPTCQSTTGEWCVSSPHFTMRNDRLMTHKKDSGFREVLSKIQERNKRTSVCEI